MSYETGDLLTNAVPIEVQYKAYNGGITIKCSVSSPERHYVSSPGEQQTKKGRKIAKQTINIVEDFPVPVAFLFGAKLGEYVRLEYLLSEYRYEEGKANHITELITNTRYSVSYPENFRQTGICSLHPQTGGQPKEYYSKRLDKKIIQHYFTLKQVKETEVSKRGLETIKLVRKPVIEVGELRMEAMYYVAHIYKKGVKSKTIVKPSFSDGWVERAANGLKNTKAELYVWVTKDGISAKFKLNHLKKCL
jgi:hypothetical protein